MRAAIIDTGAYLAELRAVGPPDVVTKPNFAGNANTSEKADLYWEDVVAVTFTLTAAAGGGTRLPRLQWIDGDGVPFAAVQAPVGRAGGGASIFSFVRGVYPSGILSSPTIVTPIPDLTLLPNWSVLIDIAAGAAGDTVSNVRVARQLWQPIRLLETLPEAP